MYLSYQTISVCVLGWLVTYITGIVNPTLQLSVPFHIRSFDSNRGNYTTYDSPQSHSTEVDEQLYSRQLLVYGKAAQRNLLNYHVGIIYEADSIGSQALASEVIKNLALAGLGRMSILPNGTRSNNHYSRKLHGHHDNLAEYASALNPRMQVTNYKDIDAFFHENQKCQLVISVGNSLTANIELNDQCRKHETKMIVSSVYGVCGFVFNDFLDKFVISDVDGETPRRILLDSLNVLSSNNRVNHLVVDDKNKLKIRVQCIDEEVLSLGIGDHVEISWLDSLTRQLHSVVSEVESVVNRKVVDIIVHHSNSIEPLLQELLGNSGTSFTLEKIKESRTINHKGFKHNLRSPEFSPCNGCLSNKQDKALNLCILACFKSLESFNHSNGTDTTLVSYEVFRRRVLAKLVGLGVKNPEVPIKKGGIGTDLIDQISHKFWRSTSPGIRSTASCPATISIVGALAAQEAIKSATGVHCPAQQFLLFESLDSLMPQSVGINEDFNHTSSYPIVQIYGKELADELRQLRIFVIGAGAIGCELLKTFALLGISEQEIDYQTSDENINKLSEGLSNYKGKIVLTDMDHIERSNLNRQLLFREHHVGRSKAEVAAEAIKLINSKLNVEVHTKRIGPDTEDTFNSIFWNDIDIIATALDNVDARRYADSQAVIRGRWMVDSGTLGTKGNTQVIIPFITESYSTSTDPPEEAIPLCTLKSFPYQPDHCIAWAKNIFDQLFTSDIIVTKDLLMIYNDSSNISKIQKLLSTSSTEDITRILYSLEGTCNVSTLIDWAMNTFHQYFYFDIQKLLDEHPPDSMDEEGEGPFWSGSRRIPRPIHSFNILDDNHHEFVFQLASIQSRIWGLNISTNEIESEIKKYLLTNNPSNWTNIDNNYNQLSKRIKTMISKSSTSIGDILHKLREESFEKDDLSLGHINFVASASALRGHIYSIPSLAGGRLAVQQIAGKIIPALATSTAIVSGLVCHEIIKIAGERIIARKLMNQIKITQQAKANEDMSKTSSKVESQQKSKRFTIFPSSLFKRKDTSQSIDENKLVENHKESSSISNDRDIFAHYQNNNKERLLNRFRNSFLNVARPLLSFVQPVEAAVFTIGEEKFTAWDVLEYKQTSLDTLSLVAETLLKDMKLSDFSNFINDRFNDEVRIQSLSLEDTLLFADFMTQNSDDDNDNDNDDDETIINRESQDLESMSIEQLLQRAYEDEYSIDMKNELLLKWQIRGYVDFEVVGVNESGDTIELPPVRIQLKSHLHSLKSANHQEDIMSVDDNEEEDEENDDTSKENTDRKMDDIETDTINEEDEDE